MKTSERGMMIHGNKNSLVVFFPYNRFLPVLHRHHRNSKEFFYREFFNGFYQNAIAIAMQSCSCMKKTKSTKFHACLMSPTILYSYALCNEHDDICDVMNTHAKRGNRREEDDNDDDFFQFPTPPSS